MARLNITLDSDHLHLLDMIRKFGEPRSEAIREGLYLLARERGFEVVYRPAELTIKNVH